MVHTTNQSRCVLCGECKETTTEHLPPRSCFPKPRPNNLITVPACEDCNGSRSALDEEFSAFLGIVANEVGDEGKALWNQRLRTICHNNKIRQKIAENTRPSEKPDRVIHSLNFGNHTPIFESIFRGLYFKQFGDIYPQEYKFEITFRTQLFPEDKELIERLFKGQVGIEAFRYGINRDEQFPQVVAGMLIFYNRFAVVGLAGLPSMG